MKNKNFASRVGETFVINCCFPPDTIEYKELSGRNKETKN